jgi:sugar-specific transcriptional regulator TrmB
MLTALGATETEDSVYWFLATAVSATGAEIRSATGLSAGKVRFALAGLQRRGLVSPTSDDPVGYVASSPGTVEAMISKPRGPR